MVPIFKIVGKRSTAKNYCPVSLLSVVSKVFEKLVNERVVGHLEKYGLFSDFQYGLRSSRSTADLLTVASDRIARAFQAFVNYIFSCPRFRAGNTVLGARASVLVGKSCTM